MTCKDYDALFSLLFDGLTYSVSEAASNIGVDSADLQFGLKRIKEVAPFLIVWDKDVSDGSIRVPKGARWQVEDMLRGIDGDEKGKKGFCNVYLTPDHLRKKAEQEEIKRRKELEDNAWEATAQASKYSKQANVISVCALIVSFLALLATLYFNNKS